MYLIVIAWTYVTLTMAVAEATSPVGTVLGAVITFILYGVLPMGILVYILSTPARKRAIKAREAQAQAAYDAAQAAQAAQTAHAVPAAPSKSMAQRDPSEQAKAPTTVEADAASVAPDAGGKSTAAAQGNTVTPVGKEP